MTVVSSLPGRLVKQPVKQPVKHLVKPLLKQCMGTSGKTVVSSLSGRQMRYVIIHTSAYVSIRRRNLRHDGRELALRKTDEILATASSSFIFIVGFCDDEDRL